MRAIPERFPATGADAAISITRSVTFHRIGVSLEFPGAQLDCERLSQAAGLMLDAEPLLGCAFHTDARRAYWQRMQQTNDAIYRFQVTASVKEGMRAFQAEEVPDEGPQFALAHFRTAHGDVLGLKASHVLADGQAAKQLTYLLADLYSRLENEPDYVPEPNLRDRPCGRDVWSGLTSSQRREARRARSWSRPTWPSPTAGHVGNGLTYQWITIPAGSFRRLKEHGVQRGCTVNDMMLTAVLRGCIACLDPPSGVPLSLMYTADLRRYLDEPETLPVSNVSISGSLDIPRVDGENFDDTLARVHTRMEQWERMCHGAGPFATAERVAGLGYKTTERLLGAAFSAGRKGNKTYPWFTNVGVLDDSRLMFGEHVPEAGFMFGPATSGASIIPVISTYREALTVCMGYCESDLDGSFVQGLLNCIRSEIDRSCH